MYKIIGVTPNLLQLEIVDVDAYHKQPNEDKLSIGSYLKISDDKGLTIIAVAQSFKVRDQVYASAEADQGQPTFLIEAQQVGCFKDGVFKRGGQQIAIPPTNVEVASEDDLNKIYAGVEPAKKFVFSTLSQNASIDVVVDGDKFFGKHIGVVGSTGSGKSCAVAKILQEGMSPSSVQAENSMLNNSHIIIFDLHGEYGPAFPAANSITIDNLALPYWLMNSEELEEMFIESQEQNSHNQVSQFKLAVIMNKKRHNPGLTKVTYDTPAYFSIKEVCQYIRNQNFATKDAKTGLLAIKEKPADVEEQHQLFEEIVFEEKATGKFNNGPYAGDFERFISRLDTKSQDDRLAFLLGPCKPSGDPYRTDDLGDIIRQFIGYGGEANSNVTIIDLSGIPFEVLSIVVSLITRLIFDFCFHFKRLKSLGSELPFLLVYEEAHNYIPRNEGAKYKSVTKSIERIAKEGRKYGVSLMIVSQRPSEISDTIFSQCNNFVAMRLTNPADQQYIKRLLPDSVNALTDALPVLERQEAIVIGDSLAVPSVVRMSDIIHKPNSLDIDFHTEWKKDWLEQDIAQVVQRLIGALPEVCE
ncbi:MAG: ATP-binding protein [Janthinobacterium lividum]